MSGSYVWLVHTYEHGPLKLLKVVKDEETAQAIVRDLMADKAVPSGHEPGYERERLFWTMREYTSLHKEDRDPFNGSLKSVWAVVSDSDGHRELECLFASLALAQDVLDRTRARNNDDPDPDEYFVVEVPVHGPPRDV